MTDNHYGQTGIAEDSGFPDISEEAYKAYFSTPARQGLIQQLLHLVRYGDGIPVVQGSGRSGKTAIAKELVSQLEEVSHLALVEVKSDARLLDVLVEVLRQYGFDVDENVSEGELLAELRRFSQALENDRNLGVLVLDNAHSLDDQSLGAIVSLLQGSDAAGHGMHLVFFAQPDLVSRIDELGLLDVSVYDFDVPLLSPSELSDFLKKHLEYRAETSPKLSAETVQAIWSRSRGAPGYSLRLMLDTMRSNTSISKPLLRNLPLGHVVALSVLAVILVWALLLRNTSPDPDRTVSEVALTDSEVITDSAAGVAAPDEFEPADFQPGESETAATDIASEMSPPDKETGTAEIESNGSEVAESSAAVEQVRAKAQILDIERTRPPQVIAPTQQRRPAGTSSPPSSDTVLNTLGEGSRFTADEKFLLVQNPASFTLQVMGASGKEALEKFIETQKNSDSLFLYEGRRNGKAWFVVTAGVYPSREAATTAMANLPAEQKKGGPWPRQLQNIQGEIKANRNK